MKNIIELVWEGCYGESWANEIVPGAFTHPAKFSRALIRRIYQFLFDEGLLREGLIVLDPFGGVALGALDGMLKGCHWIGVELEEKFVKLGNQNIELWNQKYGDRFSKWGSARLVQGDSRQLIKVLQEAGVIVSSPPYAQLDLQSGGWKGDPKQDPRTKTYNRDNSSNLANLCPGDVGTVISSAPFNENKSNAIHGQTKGFHSRDKNESKNRMKRDYILGDNPGNLGNLKPGDVNVIVGSSPYSSDVIKKRGYDKWADGKDDGGASWGRRKDGVVITDEYSDNPDNLGNMKEGNVSAVIGSAPFVGVTPTAGDPNYAHKFHGNQNKYSDNPKNLGNLREGNVSVIVSSSPYSGIAAGAGGLNTKPAKEGQQGGRSPESASQDTDQHYGKSEGQLSEMKPGSIDGIVSSPPYEGSANEKQHGNSGIAGRENAKGNKGFNFRYTDKTDAIVSSPPYEASLSSEKSGIDWSKVHREDGSIRDMSEEPGQATRPGAGGELRYSQAENNIGNQHGENFWSAAQMIVAQCYELLAVNGVAVWVCKDFVRKKKRVTFSADWARLCESVGFRQTHWIHAMLIEHRGTQLDLDGESHENLKESKSFFRRLGEQKAAEKNYFESLDREEQARWLRLAHDEMWAWYNSLTDAERAEFIDDDPDKGLKNVPPSEGHIKMLACHKAFKESGENPRDWNEEVRIDWEDVLVFVKDMPVEVLQDVPEEILQDTPQEIAQQAEKVPIVPKTVADTPKKTRFDGVEKECPQCGQLTLFNMAGGWKCPYCGYDVME